MLSSKNLPKIRSITSNEERWNLFLLEQNSKEWKEKRNGLLTASVLPSLWGLGYQSAKYWFQVYSGTKKEKEPTPFEKNLFEKGHFYEDKVLQDLENQGKILIRPGLYVSPVHPWLGATLDAILLSDNTKDDELDQPPEFTNVEVKWTTTDLPQNVKEVKLRYVIQVYAQMFITGIPQTDLIVTSETEKVFFRFHADQEIFDSILRTATRFKDDVNNNLPEHWGRISVKRCQDYWEEEVARLVREKKAFRVYSP